MTDTPITTGLPSDLLDTRQAAAYLGLSPTTLRHHRHLGKGAPYVRLGERTIRYRRADLDAWVGGSL